MSVDVAIRHGLVVDGTGAEPVRADVALAGGRVVQVGGEVPAAAKELDAGGRVVAPGFIDIHSHSDYTLLVDPRAVSAIHQGVTTEVVGNCGFGCFPIRDPSLAGNAIYGFRSDLPLTWSSADEYFSVLAAARPAVNVASLVPNGQLRLSVVGLEERAARSEEVHEMQRLLEESLEQGAWGYSTGLEYAAERGATEDELVELCSVCARHGGLYATHTRNRDGASAEAVAEAVRTAERAAARLQVSHLVPRDGLESARRCVEHVEGARARGVDAAFDMHTRRYGTTYLRSALPPWALDAPELLRDRSARERMKGYTSILSAGDDWSRVVVLDNDVWPDYSRRDLAEIARERGQEPLDAVYDLLAADDASGLMVIIRCYTEEQQREAFGHPLCVPGSDATTLAPDGPLGSSVFHGAYTWAAWFLRFVVREQRVLGLAEAVGRLTSAPAERVGLPDRGVLRPGAHGDIVVFDADRIEERGTTFEPNRLATGVTDVLVNGVVTLRDGRLTGDRAGALLRR